MNDSNDQTNSELPDGEAMPAVEPAPKRRRSRA